MGNRRGCGWRLEGSACCGSDGGEVITINVVVAVLEVGVEVVFSI